MSERATEREWTDAELSAHLEDLAPYLPDEDRPGVYTAAERLRATPDAPTEEREDYSATVGKEISKPVEDEVDDRMEWGPEFSEECLTDTLEHLEGGAPLKNVWHWPATGISRAAVRDALLTGIMLARRLRAPTDEAPEGETVADEVLSIAAKAESVLRDLDQLERRLRQPEPAREGDGEPDGDE